MQRLSVTLNERVLTSYDDVHDEIVRTLGVPAHYGRNLAALSDCLQDATQPTTVRVLFDREEGPMHDYLEKIVRIAYRVQAENPAVDVRLGGCPE